MDGSLRSFSKFLMPKFETPMFLTLPVAGSFCISCHVFMKSQSGRCFFKSVGSVDEGHYTKLVSIGKDTQRENYMDKVEVNVVDPEVF